MAHIDVGALPAQEALHDFACAESDHPVDSVAPDTLVQYTHNDCGVLRFFYASMPQIMVSRDCLDPAIIDGRTMSGGSKRAKASRRGSSTQTGAVLSTDGEGTKVHMPTKPLLSCMPEEMPR